MTLHFKSLNHSHHTSSKNPGRKIPRVDKAQILKSLGSSNPLTLAVRFRVNWPKFEHDCKSNGFFDILFINNKDLQLFGFSFSLITLINKVFFFVTSHHKQGGQYLKVPHCDWIINNFTEVYTVSLNHFKWILDTSFHLNNLHF